MEENPYKAPQTTPYETNAASDARVRLWRKVESLVYLLLGVTLALCVLVMLFMPLIIRGSGPDQFIFLPIPLLVAVLSVMLIKASRDLSKRN